MNSHLPLLSAIFSFTNIQTVLEIGTGIFSTPLFSSNAKHVVSIEQQNKEWIDKCKSQLTNDNVVEFLYLETIEKLHVYFTNCPKFDLLFIDGIYREYFMANTITCSELIVVHDSQSWMTGNITVKVPTDKQWFVWCNGNDPATSILTTNKSLIENVAKQYPKGRI